MGGDTIHTEAEFNYAGLRLRPRIPYRGTSPDCESRECDQEVSDATLKQCLAYS